MKSETERAIRQRAREASLEAALRPVSATVRAGTYVADVRSLLIALDALRAENKALAERR